MTQLDPLFYALLAVLALVFGYAVRRTGRRTLELPTQEQAEDLQHSAQAETSQRDAKVDGRETWGRNTEQRFVAQPRATETSPASLSIHSPRRRRAHEMLRSRSGLRTAVVAMTVLGPCRADQPHSTV